MSGKHGFKMAAFPLIKLGSLAIKQISKPLANKIKDRAKTHPVFRNYVCIPLAQIYHTFDVHIKMRLLGVGKITKVPKLNEAAATELGAELLGETIIFVIAAGTIAFEYWRQNRNSSLAAAQVEARWLRNERHIDDLQFLVERHAEQLRELKKLAEENLTHIKELKQTVEEYHGKIQTKNQDPLSRQVDEVVDKMIKNDNKKF